MEEKRYVCRVLLGKRGVKRGPGRLIHRRKDNIKMHLTEIERMV
jgi:hypothetical protein